MFGCIWTAVSDLEIFCDCSLNETMTNLKLFDIDFSFFNNYLKVMSDFSPKELDYFALYAKLSLSQNTKSGMKKWSGTAGFTPPLKLSVKPMGINNIYRSKCQFNCFTYAKKKASEHKGYFLTLKK